MARITYTGIVQNITGSIGGLTFQKNSSGYIVRLRPIQKKGLSENQQATINKSFNLNVEYHKLTVFNKELWNDYALLYEKTNKFGQIKKNSGFNWFVSINSIRILAGNTIAITPPAHDLAYPIPNYQVYINAGRLLIEFETLFTPNNNVLSIWLSKPTQITSKKISSKLFNIAIFNNTDYHIIDITSFFENYFQLPNFFTEIYNIYSLTCLIHTIEKNSGLISVAKQATFKTDNAQEGISFWSINTDFRIN